MAAVDGRGECRPCKFLWEAHTRPAQWFVGLASIADAMTHEGLHACGPDDALAGVLVTLGVILCAGAKKGPWIDYGLNVFIRFMAACVWSGMTFIQMWRDPSSLAAWWGVAVSAVLAWLFVRCEDNDRAAR